MYRLITVKSKRLDKHPNRSKGKQSIARYKNSQPSHPLDQELEALNRHLAPNGKSLPSPRIRVPASAVQTSATKPAPTPTSKKKGILKAVKSFYGRSTPNMNVERQQNNVDSGIPPRNRDVQYQSQKNKGKIDRWGGKARSSKRLKNAWATGEQHGMYNEREPQLNITNVPNPVIYVESGSVVSNSQRNEQMYKEWGGRGGFIGNHKTRNRDVQFETAKKKKGKIGRWGRTRSSKHLIDDRANGEEHEMYDERKQQFDYEESGGYDRDIADAPNPVFPIQPGSVASSNHRNEPGFIEDEHFLYDDEGSRISKVESVRSSRPHKSPHNGRAQAFYVHDPNNEGNSVLFIESGSVVSDGRRNSTHQSLRGGRDQDRFMDGNENIDNNESYRKSMHRGRNSPHHTLSQKSPHSHRSQNPLSPHSSGGRRRQVLHEHDIKNKGNPIFYGDSDSILSRIHQTEAKQGGQDFDGFIDDTLNRDKRYRKADPRGHNSRHHNISPNRIPQRSLSPRSSRRRHQATYNQDSKNQANSMFHVDSDSLLSMFCRNNPKQGGAQGNDRFIDDEIDKRYSKKGRRGQSRERRKSPHRSPSRAARQKAIYDHDFDIKANSMLYDDSDSLLSFNHLREPTMQGGRDHDHRFIDYDVTLNNEDKRYRKPGHRGYSRERKKSPHRYSNGQYYDAVEVRHNDDPWYARANDIVRDVSCTQDPAGSSLSDTEDNDSIRQQRNKRRETSGPWTENNNIMLPMVLVGAGALLGGCLVI